MRGIVGATIAIDYHVWFANIVGRTFLNTITIGRFIKGAVVAVGGAQAPDPTDPTFLDGYIREISIGRGDLPPNDPSDWYARSGPGLCGIDALPLDVVSMEEWFQQSVGRDAGALDGLSKRSPRSGPPTSPRSR